MLYKCEYISASIAEVQLHKNTKIYMKNSFSLEGKIPRQIPNNFTILNRYYNT